MPSIPEQGSRVRLTLELSNQLNAELERLATESGRSKAELLRLAADFLSKADQARQEGMTVGAWKENPSTGTRVERQFLGL